MRLLTAPREASERAASAKAVTPFRLTGSPTVDELVATRREVVRALSSGAPSIVVDVDGLTTLDSAVIATLIVILREARERGASVALLAERESIVETLRASALDKIFVIRPPLAAQT